MISDCIWIMFWKRSQLIAKNSPPIDRHRTFLIFSMTAPEALRMTASGKKKPKMNK
jgi:hypothetical protein